MRLDSFAILKNYNNENIFGKPRKGVHSTRVVDVAVVDYAATVVAAFVLWYFTTIPVEVCTIGMFLLGIVAHIAFGVDTTTTRWLRRAF